MPLLMFRGVKKFHRRFAIQDQDVDCNRVALSQIPAISRPNPNRPAAKLLGSMCPQQPNLGHYYSLFSKHQIHAPAASNVWPFAVAVAQDVPVVAASGDQNIGEGGQPVKRSFVVDCFGEGDDARFKPCGVNGYGAERIANDFAEERRQADLHLMGRISSIAG